MNKGERRTRKAARQSQAGESVVAGVAARFAYVVKRLRSGNWDSPVSMEDLDYDVLDDWDEPDDGGLSASGVRQGPPDKSGSGSAALVEPED